MTKLFLNWLPHRQNDDNDEEGASLTATERMTRDRVEARLNIAGRQAASSSRTFSQWIWEQWNRLNIPRLGDTGSRKASLVYGDGSRHDPNV